MNPALTLGIAGHVDHGKTSLVRALTGQETDRLDEEQRRGISIELGFAHLDVSLPSGSAARLGIVDMPGHERFVRRMIAGTAGIDAVIMVVAADEGIMPQGREHVAICELLGIERGMIVLTKVDLADEELLELVADDVKSELAGTFLADAPIAFFSAKQSDQHIPELLTSLGVFAGQILSTRTNSSHQERPFRLPVDRCFSMKGRGTVITGTAASGAIEVGESLRVWPSAQTARIREIERHGHALQRFTGPGRLALNLARLAVDQVPVGAILAPPGSLELTTRFDARVTLLRHVERPWRRRQAVILHIGTAHTEAAITLLEDETLAPGSTALVQVHLKRPIAVAAAEHFVVRGSALDPRHGQTVAGGKVLFAAPPRHRLADPAVISALRKIDSDAVEQRIEGMLEIMGLRGLSLSDIQRFDPGTPKAIEKALRKAVARNAARKLGGEPRYFSPQHAEQLRDLILAAVSREHQLHPEREGLGEDTIHERVGSWLPAEPVAVVTARLLHAGALSQRGPAVALPDHVARVTVARQELVEDVVAAVSRHNLATPPPVGLRPHLSIAPKTDAELQLALDQACATGTLIRVAKDYYVPRVAVISVIDALHDLYGATESFTTGDLKAVVGLTRKHLIPFAEALDALRVTVRDPSGNRRFRRAALEKLQRGESALPPSTGSAS